jgi:hypothetical protein
MSKRQKQRNCPKKIFRIPDLEHAKHVVINSLPAKASQESHAHAIDEFINLYCLEPRLSFNWAVVPRCRFFLEQKNAAPSTINVRLAAVGRIAYDAADVGFFSPELAEDPKTKTSFSQYAIQSFERACCSF